MICSFKNDYSEGTHPRILEVLSKTNFEQQDGYSEDAYCLRAAELIKEKIEDPKADVHFVSGGTQANAVVIGAMLKPYEAVIAADTGHINVHEAGAVENRGHKVITVVNSEGRLTRRDIESVLAGHTDEHMVLPRMVYLSNTTETGTIYSRAELLTIFECCQKNGLYLYLDGARLGCAMTAQGNDLTLPLINQMVDVFYIGGTKNGGLIGEAIVIKNNRFKHEFRFHLKQNGALLSKSRLFGLQFYELFKDNLYFEMAAHANHMASRLAGTMEKMGIPFLCPPVTNQIFPILPNSVIERLSENFAFYVWQKMDDRSSAVRLVTSWATKQEAVDQFLSMLEDYLRKNDY